MINMCLLFGEFLFVAAVLIIKFQIDLEFFTNNLSSEQMIVGYILENYNIIYEKCMQMIHVFW